MRTEIARPVRLADYRPPNHLIDRVRLTFSLAHPACRVAAELDIRPNPAGVAGAPLVLDGDDLDVRAIALDGVHLDLAAGLARRDGLRIDAPPQRPFTLRTETMIDAAANTQLMGLFRTGAAWCTQCEAEGFRRITYFLDRPDVLSLYVTRIEADVAQAPVLLGNGNCVESGALPDGRHYAVWDDPYPKPSYLFALVAGDLGVLRDTFTTASGRAVALGIYVEPGKEPRAIYAMGALKRSMRWDEEAFGRQYDLDVFNIVAVSDFNMGAMENKGLNVFNDKYVLALPQTATDSDYAGIEAVIAHEYFHNWTGNRITCRDWFQLCLKEGLTVFRDQEFSSDQRSRAVKRISDVRGLRAQQFVEDAGPLAHNVRPETYMEINNFYTATIYEKGAEIIRMLKTLIGPDAFARGMALYFERYDGAAATMEDFLGCFTQASGRHLGQFMRWYDQAGTPRLKAELQHDPALARLVLTLSQTTPATPGQADKQPAVIPVALGFITPQGAQAALCADIAPGATQGATAAELESGIFVLETSRRVIVFDNLPERPTPSLLRGFSAPVILETPLEAGDLITLARHDHDPFNRWQAVQTFATQMLLAAVKGQGAAYDPRLAEALRALLDDDHEEPAFAAQVLALPSEADLARDMRENVDPDRIHQARRALRAALGSTLAPSLVAVYERHAARAAYQPDAAGAGRRALRNAALDLLTAGDASAGGLRAAAQLAAADNMTDEIAALGALAQTPGASREAAFARFFDRYRDDALVIDKWFALQAVLPEAETLDRVRGLMTHPAFSMSNPNRVRALIGAFASGNPTQFHRADGAGYAFIIDRVLELDPKNPQVAARMLSTFRTWRSLEPARRTKAEAALRRVLDYAELSADVRDIATRSLA